MAKKVPEAYSKTTEKSAYIEPITNMKDLSKVLKSSITLFEKAEEEMTTLQEHERQLTIFEANIHEMENHIIAENNEGRAKMDAVITTHSRRFFKQDMYTNAKDRLLNGEIIDYSADGNDTDSNNGTGITSVAGNIGAPIPKISLNVLG